MEGISEGNVLTIANKIALATTFKWPINDINTFHDQRVIRSKLESPLFSDGTKFGLKWKLIIESTNWKTYCSSYYFNLKLFLASEIFVELKTDCRFSFLDATNINVQTLQEKLIFSDSNKICTINFRLPVKFLQGSNLTVLCEIEYLVPESENISIPPALSNNDFGLALLDTDLSVVTFSVSGRELQALRAVLVASSPVFEAMINHDMQERKSSRIEITDVDYEVLMEILRFIYTNKISNLENIADRLLIAANKFALENLKRICEESMINNLSVENAVQYIILAHQHNAENLKMQAKSFISAHTQAVAETVGSESVVIGKLLHAILDPQS